MNRSGEGPPSHSARLVVPVRVSESTVREAKSRIRRLRRLAQRGSSLENAAMRRSSPTTALAKRAGSGVTRTIAASQRPSARPEVGLVWRISFSSV